MSRAEAPAEAQAQPDRLARISGSAGAFCWRVDFGKSLSDFGKSELGADIRPESPSKQRTKRERKQLQLILLAAAAQGQTGGRGTTRRRETSLHTYTRDTGGAGHKNNEHARRSARVCRSQCTRG